ncbi:YggS family pyridoxal phosphate-dependent enzyme [Bacteriovorax stolpii]|uniref:YggS family pyridoxal phosphate-dependent enzyme n=1 Tax=Bacteriovorax stolpii TaxID=960 RepID=UPI0011571CFE|nr:YggS family pyridoxal phosphate-dependent enzyme [Bacteriovorax stolpii]QDK41559.1 YggS family pyridoxal phosphate-dependent enzyme [Bacteriovorax stolpii]
MIKTDLDQRLRSLKAELGSSILVAVSKYSPIDDVAMAYELGQMDFGENRVQDLEEKAAAFATRGLKDVRWHFIGNLQSNKVKELLKIPNLWSIHSVSSKKLVEEIIKREGEFKGEELKLFFQLNTSHEDEKSGFDSVEEMLESMLFLKKHGGPKLVIHGLMTMGSVRSEDFEAAALKCFGDLKNARELAQKELGLSDLKLSMGMSQDYKMALREGADYIRVGSAIFK